MSFGFHCVFDRGPVIAPDKDRGLVDVVAVHDIVDDCDSAWTDPVSRINWVKHFLPHDVNVGRIVLYHYDATAETFFGNGAAQQTQRRAESFVQELNSERQFGGTIRRPIIFICHGLGGVLVKKSLIYSSTRLSPRVAHLRDQYVSTFAIIFFGTPHGKTCGLKWAALQRQKPSKQHSVLPALHFWNRSLQHEGQVPQAVDNEFLHLSDRFHMLFFWSELPTNMISEKAMIVPPECAVPRIDHAETASIHATHVNMARFGSRTSSTYRTVLASLLRYCDKAPVAIENRWVEADQQLRQFKTELARELAGLQPTYYAPSSPACEKSKSFQYFSPPEKGSPTFIGRQRPLDILRSKFFPNGQPTQASFRKTFVIFGIGGSGKTELCAEFANEWKHMYPAVFTIRAASKDTIADSFAQIGKAAGLEPTERSGRHFLSQISIRFLLIIDNADDPELKVRGLFPPNDKAHVLITTRCPNFRCEGELGSLELEGLEDDEAVQLLLTIAAVPQPWNPSTTETAHRIAQALGHLALALVHAGTCIFEQVCELDQYLEVHQEAREEIRRRGTSLAVSDVEKNVCEKLYSTFDLSMNTLVRSSADIRQDAEDLLDIMCFYHFDNVPIELFARAVRNRSKYLLDRQGTTYGSRFFQNIVKRVEPRKLLPEFLRGNNGTLAKYRVNHAVAKLRSLSLVAYDGYSISLHPLVHAWKRDTLSVSDRKVWAAIALNTLMQSVSLPPEGNSDLDGQFHRELLPHLRACLRDHGDPITPFIQSVGASRFFFARFFQHTLLLTMAGEAENSSKCGWVFAERGLFSDASEYFRQCKNTLVRALGRADDRTMKVMVGLAKVYWGLGRLSDAIALQQFVVDERTRKLGPEHEETLQVMSDLGQSYWLNGLYKEALDLQLATVERMKSVIGPHHPHYVDTLAAMDNLGVIYGSWHRFEESRSVHAEVLEIRQRLQGVTHSDTLTTKAYMAMALLDLGSCQDAKALMHEVYENRWLLLGQEHPWTLWALCYLAKVLIETDELEMAEAMLVRGIEAGKRSLDENHLGVLMGRGVLARVYARQGRLDEAEALTLEVVAALGNTRGKEHPDCIFGLLKTAQLYLLKGCRTKALEMAKLGAARSEVRLTSLHPMSQELINMVRVLENPSSTGCQLQQLLPTLLRTALSALPIDSKQW